MCHSMRLASTSHTAVAARGLSSVQGSQDSFRPARAQFSFYSGGRYHHASNPGSSWCCSQPGAQQAKEVRWKRTPHLQRQQGPRRHDREGASRMVSDACCRKVNLAQCRSTFLGIESRQPLSAHQQNAQNAQPLHGLPISWFDRLPGCWASSGRPLPLAAAAPFLSSS